MPVKQQVIPSAIWPTARPNLGIMDLENSVLVNLPGINAIQQSGIKKYLYGTLLMGTD